MAALSGNRLKRCLETFALTIEKNGAACRIRTCDPRITNAMLYQLS